MKITKVETILLKMPIRLEGDVVPKASGAPRTAIDLLMVRIDTDEGISGWGEGFGHRIYSATKAALDTFIGNMCVGRDPTHLNAIVEDMQRGLGGVGRNGPAMYALSAIDIALWDIAGKIANLPLYRLLGGSPRKDLPGYASLLRYGQPDIVTKFVDRALKRGYRHIKLHEITVDAIAAARSTAGDDASIMVDCNCPWTVDQAIDMARRLQPYNLTWFEEPIWPPEDADGLRRVRDLGGIPTAAGENAMFTDFKRMFDAGALAYAQPSVTKVGGVTMMRKVAALAEAAGVTVVPHSAYFGPGLLASIHCIAAMPKETLVERYDCDFELNPLHDAIDANANGRITIPQGPGLGLDPEPAVIERLRVA